MSLARLRQRVPSAQRIGPARLQAHVLKFHKISARDGSAKCDAAHSGNPDDILMGVVFEIDAAEKPRLDQAEGLGYGYEQKQVKVTGDDGASIEAFTYYATRIDPGLKPFDWYKQHVLIGARENALPPDYIAAIETIESIPDPDRQRHDAETAIYRETGQV